MFLSRKQNNVYPCKPQFYYIKVGFKGVKIILVCFRDDNHMAHLCLNYCLSGSGPFPGLIDMFGGLVSLVETRAALLASHGFASFALVYMYQDDLAQQVSDVDIRYIQVGWTK